MQYNYQKFNNRNVPIKWKTLQKRGKNLQKKLSEDYIEYDNDYYLYVSLYVEYDNKIDKYKVIDTYVKMDGLVKQWLKC